MNFIILMSSITIENLPDANQSEIEARYKKSHSLALKAALVSLVVGTLVMFIKFGAYFFSGSQAILSDALESIINVVAAGFVVYTVIFSAGGTDRYHPYGKGRIEYFSAGFEGGLIVIAAFLILYTSIPRIFNPVPLVQLDYGIILTVVASGVNGTLGLFLIRTGKKEKSLAVEADGHHVMSDVITSSGMIVALVIVYFTDILWLDPLIASFMALWILRSGYVLLVRSYNRLMDRISDETLADVVAAIQNNRMDKMIHPHKLRARESGNLIIIDFHLTTPKYLTVEQVHEMEVEFGHGLVKTLSRPVDLLLHTDPCISDNCTCCQVKGCKARSHKYTQEFVWTTETLLADVTHPFAD